ncbi:nuclear transport factor 2 family protein [Archangium primigenium]|uniref:nuclear transport factor 2 family protein n=1 Tax=[Archangium] primigenium TaxID=2792470 RepID=UPI00195D584D|nr:nuclear transport factor 2 family protein [Archangium primigenium]MBM7117245.1 nuclear transport factor 2 family protein [Archangium primigenium]
MTPPSPHDAGALLDAHLALIGTDIERWLALFAEDAVVEFPYARSLGVPERLEGIAAIRGYFAQTPKHFLGLAFTNVRRYLTTDPELAIAEVHGTATIATTGKPYAQDYVFFVKTRQGRISLYREYWDPLPGLEAFGGPQNLRRMVDAS